MLQIRSSSAESAQANTEANVSGPCLDTSGKIIEMGSKKGGIFCRSEVKWNLEFSCGFGVGLRIFCPERAKRRGTQNYVVKREKGRRIGPRINCPSKRKKKIKVNQFRKWVRCPVRWAGRKVVIESVSQIDSKIKACSHFMQPINNRLVPSLIVSWSQ